MAELQNILYIMRGGNTVAEYDRDNMEGKYSA